MKKLLGLFVIAGIATVPISARAANGALPGAGAAVMAGSGGGAGAASDMVKLQNRLDASQATLDSIMHVQDKGIPEDIAQKARCVIVVPGLFKGAFIFGAEYGQGVVTCRTAHGWSGPVFIRMAGGSWGFQIGGKGTDLVMVAKNQRGMDDLLTDKFTIGGGASAAVGPIGRTANAETDISMHADLLSWSRSKGLFAGVDLKGTTVSQNVADTAELYGKVYPYNEILAGHVPAPAAARPFLHAVGMYFGAVAVHHREKVQQQQQ